ncbi:hypothetical protein V8E54_012327 [Elaphomyces granulatus]
MPRNSCDAGELFVNLSNSRLCHSTAETSTMNSEPMTKVFNFVPSYKATPAKTRVVSWRQYGGEDTWEEGVGSYYPQQLLRNGQARRVEDSLYPNTHRDRWN